MTCIECGESSKYKCPTCWQPYCSVPCFKAHKQNPCSRPPDQGKPEENDQQNPLEFDYPTEDTVPVEKLKLLEKSPQLRRCLDNPHLRVILDLLDKSSHPDELMQEYMQEPIFTEFVDECLKIVQPPV